MIHLVEMGGGLLPTTLPKGAQHSPYLSQIHQQATGRRCGSHMETTSRVGSHQARGLESHPIVPKPTMATEAAGTTPRKPQPRCLKQNLIAACHQCEASRRSLYLPLRTMYIAPLPHSPSHYHSNRSSTQKVVYHPWHIPCGAP